MHEALALDASDATVRRRLRTAGLRRDMAAQEPVLSASNKEVRLRFAVAHQSWTMEDWGQEIFFLMSRHSPPSMISACVWRPQGAP